MTNHDLAHEPRPQVTPRILAAVMRWLLETRRQEVSPAWLALNMNDAGMAADAYDVIEALEGRRLLERTTTRGDVQWEQTWRIPPTVADEGLNVSATLYLERLAELVAP